MTDNLKVHKIGHLKVNYGGGVIRLNTYISTNSSRLRLLVRNASPRKVFYNASLFSLVLSGWYYPVGHPSQIFNGGREALFVEIVPEIIDFISSREAIDETDRTKDILSQIENILTLDWVVEQLVKQNNEESFNILGQLAFFALSEENPDMFWKINQLILKNQKSFPVSIGSFRHYLTFPKLFSSWGDISHAVVNEKKIKIVNTASLSKNLADGYIGTSLFFLSSFSDDMCVRVITSIKQGYTQRQAIQELDYCGLDDKRKDYMLTILTEQSQEEFLRSLGNKFSKSMFYFVDCDFLKGLVDDRREKDKSRNEFYIQIQQVVDFQQKHKVASIKVVEMESNEVVIEPKHIIFMKNSWGNMKADTITAFVDEVNLNEVKNGSVYFVLLEGATNANYISTIKKIKKQFPSATLYALESIYDSKIVDDFGMKTLLRTNCSIQLLDDTELEQLKYSNLFLDGGVISQKDYRLIHKLSESVKEIKGALSGKFGKWLDKGIEVNTIRPYNHQLLNKKLFIERLNLPEEELKQATLIQNVFILGIENVDNLIKDMGKEFNQVLVDYMEQYSLSEKSIII